MTDFARKVTEDKLKDEQGEATAKLAHHILEQIRHGEIVSDPVINLISDGEVVQVVRGDFISLFSSELFEEFIEIYALGYKLCPKCSAKGIGVYPMEQYITSEEPNIGIIWNWICPKCKYMDPKGWVSDEPKGEKNERN